MPVRIIFSLQSPQAGQPPSLIPVQLLQGLVTVRIVHVRVHLSAPISLVQSFTEVVAKGDSVAVQCAIHMVADDRGSNRLALYQETKGKVMNIHQEVICAVRKRGRVTRHGFHSLRRVSFEQNSRVEECRIRRECVEGIEGSSLSLDVVGLNTDWEHHVDGVMLRTHSTVYSSTVDEGESGIVCYVRCRYSWTDG
jgi:hypothetical protein